MPQIYLTQEVVALIRQLGPRNKVQLQVHLPDHDVEDIQKALENAAFQKLLRNRGDGRYEHLVPQLRVQDDGDATSIVEHALRSRSVLELGWCGALVG